VNRDPYQILHRAGGGPGRRVAGLGVLCFSLGVGGVAWRMRHPVSMVVLAVSVALLVIGAVLLAVTILRPPAPLSGLEARLRSQPETIVRAWRQGSRPVRPGARVPEMQRAVIEADDGTTWMIDGKRGQVSKILSLVASRCPDAEVRGR